MATITRDKLWQCVQNVRSDAVQQTDVDLLVVAAQDPYLWVQEVTDWCSDLRDGQPRPDISPSVQTVRDAVSRVRRGMNVAALRTDSQAVGLFALGWQQSMSWIGGPYRGAQFEGIYKDAAVSRARLDSIRDPRTNAVPPVPTNSHGRSEFSSTARALVAISQYGRLLGLLKGGLISITPSIRTPAEQLVNGMDGIFGRLCALLPPLRSSSGAVLTYESQRWDAVTVPEQPQGPKPRTRSERNTKQKAIANEDEDAPAKKRPRNRPKQKRNPQALADEDDEDDETPAEKPPRSRSKQNEQQALSEEDEAPTKKRSRPSKVRQQDFTDGPEDKLAKVQSKLDLYFFKKGQSFQK